MLFLCRLYPNNLVSHFLVIVGFCISQGVIWTLHGGYWLAVLPGLRGQSIALIKGGPKHQLKSTRPRSCDGGRGLQCECVRMHAGLRRAIEPRFSIPLCGRQYPRMWMFLPNAWQSMWDGYNSAHKDKSTRAPRGGGGGDWIWHVIYLMSSLLQSHAAQNDFVGYVRWRWRWRPGMLKTGSYFVKGGSDVITLGKKGPIHFEFSNYSLRCIIFILSKSWWETLLSIRLDCLRTPDEWDYLMWFVALASRLNEPELQCVCGLPEASCLHSSRVVLAGCPGFSEAKKTSDTQEVQHHDEKGERMNDVLSSSI